jgi:alginate O-acetyltransferase complex protein AlgJ
LLPLLALAVISISNCSTGVSTVSPLEQRSTTPFPATSDPNIFANAFSGFFTDHFAFRSELISDLSTLRFFSFGIPARPDKVLVGKHGWFYFFDGGDVETVRHYPLLTEPEIRNWVKCLQDRTDWLNKRNIKFLFVLAPSKCTMYPQFIPTEYNALNKTSRADQLCDYLKAHSTVNFIDLRIALNSNRKQAEEHKQLLYFKTDSHWNDLGACLAYGAITSNLNNLFPNLHRLEPKEVAVERPMNYHGDLIGPLGFDLHAEDTYTPVSLKNQMWSVSSDPKPPEKFGKQFADFATTFPNNKLPKAFVIRDSFTTALQPFLSHSFKRAYFHWRGNFDFPIETIEKEKPDVVIMEMVERQLARAIPPNPPSMASK